MKKKKVINILFILLLIGNYSFAQSKRELRKQEAYLSTKKLVESTKFIFEVNAVTPYGGSRIIAVGEGLLIENNMLYVSLPFIGTSHVGIIGESNKIEFTNENTEYSIKYDARKKRIYIGFEIEHKGESFTFYLSIFSNGKSNLQILSSSRSQISYDGIIKEITIP